METIEITLSQGERTRVQQVVEHRLSGMVMQLMLAYTAATLTPERAYAGIGACAAMHSVFVELGRPVD